MHVLPSQVTRAGAPDQARPDGGLTAVEPVSRLPAVVAAADFHILGPLQVLVDGEPRLLPGVKPKALLAMLLINRDRVISAGALAEALWNDDPPDAYSASLQVFVSKLRRSLRDAASRGDGVVTTASPGYRMSVNPMSVDWGRFERARANGDGHFGAGRFAEASACYNAALAEWSGPALADLRGYRFADEFAAAVDEERMGTLSARIDADLACGRDASVIAELRTLTANHPLREPFWVQLITAYYRQGRQADALDAARRIREILADELGIDPGPALQQLEQKILRQESLGEPAAPVTDELLRTQAELDNRPSAGRLVLASGRVVPVPANGLRIGRLTDNDLVIDNPKVSRHHAVIIDTGMGFAVSDLRSTNGVIVGSTRVVDSRMLQHGDQLRIGGECITFEEAG